MSRITKYHWLMPCLVLLFTVLPCRLVVSSSARADAPIRKIKEAKEEIEAVRNEVRRTEPYPGGERWVGRLRTVQAKLVEANGNDVRRCRWYERAITDFADRKKEDALVILNDVESRLSLLEDSMARPMEGAKEDAERSADDVKALLRGSQGREAKRPQTRRRVEQEHLEIRREPERREEGGHAEPAANGPGAKGGKESVVSTSSSGGGFSSWGWVLLAGSALSVIAAGVFFYLQSPRSPRPPKADRSATGSNASVQDDDTRLITEESPANLWRQADALAAKERYREALRQVYLALLASLHSRHFIRFEPTRTNGEYVRQLRLSEQAPPELHQPFQRLTQLFETAWYGERPCEESDYRAARTLAEGMM
jgi:hypothetical protein